MFCFLLADQNNENLFTYIYLLLNFYSVFTGAEYNFTGYRLYKVCTKPEGNSDRHSIAECNYGRYVLQVSGVYICVIKYFK